MKKKKTFDEIKKLGTDYNLYYDRKRLTRKYKILLVGDAAVGKTCILNRYFNNYYENHTQSTFGIDFRNIIYRVNDEIIKCTIWDTAGQERFRTLTNAFYRGSDAVIILFDLTNKESFVNIERWIKEIKSFNMENDFMKIIVGNKLDLENEIQISTHEIEEICEKYKMKYISCSAKEDRNISEIFNVILKILLEHDDKSKNNEKKIIKVMDFEDIKRENEKNNFCCF